MTDLATFAKNFQQILLLTLENSNFLVEHLKMTDFLHLLIYSHVLGAFSIIHHVCRRLPSGAQLTDDLSNDFVVWRSINYEKACSILVRLK